MPKAKAKAAKTEPWRIMTFFVAAAMRKGAADIQSQILAKPRNTLVFHDGHDYYLRSQFTGGYFLVFSDGRWEYHAGRTKLSGKLQPPHAKGWVDKMITKGTPGEIARADWQTYFNLRNQK